MRRILSNGFRLAPFSTLAIAMVVLAGCGTDAGAAAPSEAGFDDTVWIIESDRNFTLDDLVAAGWKVRKDLVLEYPLTTDAKWGFFNTKEVGVLVYETAADAQTAGLEAARAQTATDENGQAVGEIDRISCRDAQGQSAVEHRDTSGASKSVPLASLSTGLDGESQLTGPDRWPPRVCSNQFPTYSEFRIIGNIVVMCESDGRDVSGSSSTCRDLPKNLGL